MYWAYAAWNVLAQSKQQPERRMRGPFPSLDDAIL